MPKENPFDYNPYDAFRNHEPANPYQTPYGATLGFIEKHARDAVTYSFDKSTTFSVKQRQIPTVTSIYPLDILNWSLLYARALAAELVINKKIEDGFLPESARVSDLVDDRTLPQEQNEMDVQEGIGRAYYIGSLFLLNNPPEHSLTYFQNHNVFYSHEVFFSLDKDEKTGVITWEAGCHSHNSKIQKNFISTFNKLKKRIQSSPTRQYNE